MSDLRSLPSVDQLLSSSQGVEWVAGYGRSLTLEAIREGLDQARKYFQREGYIPEIESILAQIQSSLEIWVSPTLRPVINATGVILHTNLGRAPLSQAALQAATRVATGYSTLEYDLSKGKRGSRLIHAEALFKHLTGAEGALVVNNNAAAGSGKMCSHERIDIAEPPGSWNRSC